MTQGVVLFTFLACCILTPGCILDQRTVRQDTEEPGGTTAGGTPSAKEKPPANAGEFEKVDPKTLGLQLAPAPEFTDPVKGTAGRDSVMLFLPFAASARDYRVFAVRQGVSTVVTDGTEDVLGGEVFCAGLRQHNACDDDEKDSRFSAAEFSVPRCSIDARAVHTPKEVLRQVQVEGLSGDTTLVVEAIDRQCPFTGVLGATAAEIPLAPQATQIITTTVNGASKQLKDVPDTFKVRSEPEIRAAYGSVIVNGHGPAQRPATTDVSPNWNVGSPAARNPPKVLFRTAIIVKPKGTAQPPAGFDVWDDFANDSDQPVLQPSTPLVPAGFPVQFPTHHENSTWNFYSYGAKDHQFFLRRGALHSLLPDQDQEIMSANVIYPKRTFSLPPAAGNTYLHATFEIQTNATQRRYFWFHACGASDASQTYNGTRLADRSAIIPFPGFFNANEGRHISLAGWNCIQIVPRSGGYEKMAGGVGGINQRPETDVRVVLNDILPAGANVQTHRDSVVLAGPPQLNSNQVLEGAWYRTFSPQKQLSGPVLDDQMFITQRTKFDIYLHRSRVVIYVNGEQRICNDFPTHTLTQASSAIGLGHVLYHSSAERLEFQRTDWLRTAQYYYRYNTPWIDERSVDNYGIAGASTLPTDFDPRPCFSL